MGILMTRMQLFKIECQQKPDWELYIEERNDKLFQYIVTKPAPSLGPSECMESAERAFRAFFDRLSVTDKIKTIDNTEGDELIPIKRQKEIVGSGINVKIRGE